jgi:hypothetical protein
MDKQPNNKLNEVSALGMCFFICILVQNFLQSIRYLII